MMQNKLTKLISDYQNANWQLYVYLETNKIDLPVFVDFEDIKDWCIEMRGYVQCMAKHNLLISSSDNDKHDT